MYMQHATVRTTVALPTEIVERSQRFIGKGAFPNRNAFILTALERYLVELERAEIDDQFALMAEDPEYLALNEQIVEYFADTDWESLTLNERTES